MDIVAFGIWAYAVLAAVVAADSLLPVVPSEVTVIAATALAAAGDLSVLGVFTAAAIGALLGDVVTFVLGRFASGSRLGRRIRAPRNRRVRQAMERYQALGCTAIVLGRFVPMGRTCVAALAGVTRMPVTAYVSAAVVGSLAWAGYMTVLGRVGGLVARGLVAQVAIGIAVGLVVIVAAHCCQRRFTGPATTAT